MIRLKKEAIVMKAGLVGVLAPTVAGKPIYSSQGLDVDTWDQAF